MWTSHRSAVAHTMEECEKKCGKYSRCYTIAIANDMLTEYKEKETCK